MKFRDILPYIYFGNKIKIFQCDAFIDPNHEPEEIYFGSTMDVPWYIAEMFLYNTPDGEAIFVTENNGESYFEITVVEKLKNEEA